MMVTALRRGIETNSPEDVEIEVTSVATLNKFPKGSSSSFSEELISPLTISLPDHYQFPAQQVYQACQNIKGRRSWVSKKLNYETGDSQDKERLRYMWLPIAFFGPFLRLLLSPVLKIKSQIYLLIIGFV